jgi:hypothetical protein
MINAVSNNEAQWMQFWLSQTPSTRKCSGCGLDKRESFRGDPSRWPHDTTLFPQKFAPASSTSGCCSRTQATQFLMGRWLDLVRRKAPSYTRNHKQRKAQTSHGIRAHDPNCWVGEDTRRHDLRDRCHDVSRKRTAKTIFEIWQH